MRIFYAAGPGDVIGTFRHWKEGRDDPAEVAVTYSGQFFSFCRETGAAGFVVSYHPRRESVADGAFRVEHRPAAFRKGPSALYHLGQVWAGLRMIVSAVRFRADAAIVSGGTHWFMLTPLRWLGVRIIPTLHCMLWRKGRQPRGVNRFVHRLNARFFRRDACAILSLSGDITEQLRGLTGGGLPEIVSFLPSYRRASFSAVQEPAAAGPFKILYAGRIEANKGVFDLLEIAVRFAREQRQGIEFDLCGSGSALDELRSRAASAGVAARFRCHGHLTRDRMLEMYSASHVVIAPTTSGFIEGFNKVVAEAILAGRPVITSSVCPALGYVRGAVVEVPPDDVAGYGDAIIRLREDPSLYNSKRLACLSLREQFFDPQHGWGAAVRRALDHPDNPRRR